MQTNNLTRLATRLRVSRAALVALGVAGTFTESATRAMFLLPAQPVAAFASVPEPASIAYPAGFVGQRRSAIPGNGQRGAQRSIPSALPADVVTEGAPVALTAGTPVVNSGPGVASGLVTPAASPVTTARSIPIAGAPGAFTGAPGAFGGFPVPATGGGGTDTPPPAVPEPPAWMLALAGLGLLAAFKYGKNLLAIKQGLAFA